MRRSHILIKYYNVFRDRYFYLFNHFSLWNIQKWKSRTWFSLSKYRYLVSSKESGWEKVENVEFQLVNFPLVILCWKSSVRQKERKSVERLWLWTEDEFDWKIKFICIQICFPIPFLKENGGTGQGVVGKRIYINIIS